MLDFVTFLEIEFLDGDIAIKLSQNVIGFIRLDSYWFESK
jgi:hypothetical protein